MVDHRAYRIFNPSSSLGETVRNGFPGKNILAEVSEDQLITAPPGVLGFSFSDKGWGKFSVSSVSDITWNHKAFDSLVLDPARKSRLCALVKSHNTEAEDGFDDVITNKGKGLVGLLSGPPGVGKTLTAEALAEFTHRPLYMVSAGELGISPDAVDKALRLKLELGHRWKAVLLLDEADVFLQERDTRDIQRNALVSIFLRQLEYFQGILLLTTNRIESMDPAFESRIHFSLAYPDLDIASRRAIWVNFLTKGGKIKAGKEGQSTAIAGFTEKQIDELAARTLNGRQIKNIVSMAFSITEEGHLTMEDILGVLDLSHAWKEVIGAS